MPRPPPVSVDRCVERARRMREAAARSEVAEERARLTHMADAYDLLAAKLSRARPDASSDPKRPAHVRP